VASLTGQNLLTLPSTGEQADLGVRFVIVLLHWNNTFAECVWC